MPLKNKKHDGKLVICNLQPTKYDKKADLVISTYVDTIMEKVCKRLGIELPKYSEANDPTKQINCTMEWTIMPKQLKEIDIKYKELLAATKKRKSIQAEKNEEKVKKQKINDEQS